MHLIALTIFVFRDDHYVFARGRVLESRSNRVFFLFSRVYTHTRAKTNIYEYRRRADIDGRAFFSPNYLSHAFFTLALSTHIGFHLLDRPIERIGHLPRRHDR